jgi:hypothetical protein
MSSRTSSSSPIHHRPQDFYFDINVTPTRAEIKSPPLTSKKSKNRLRAFEMASRALRDEPSVLYDPLDVFSKHDPHCPTKDCHRPSSYNEQTTKPPEMLDFGNSSDSRMLYLRREEVRRDAMTSCDPSRHWGDLNHHQSSSEMALSRPPRSPATDTNRYTSA